jgi:DNA-binding MarR family transcriptional regulator
MVARSRPTPAVEAAWGTLLVAHTAILDRLDADLKAAHDLPLDSYDVLYQLAKSGGEPTMGELSDALLIGDSRCSRRVDRLVAEGLVERHRDAADHRVLHATLTERGRALQRRAAVTHLRGVQAYFGQFLTDADAAQFAEVLTASGEAARP